MKIPKGLLVEISVDKEQEYQKVKEVFVKYQALHHYKTMSMEQFIQEFESNEEIVHEMIGKELIRRYKTGYYYDEKMENDRFRLHVKTIRFMIILMVAVNFFFIVALAWSFYGQN